MFQQFGGNGAPKKSVTEYVTEYFVLGEKGTNGEDTKQRATGGGGSGGLFSWLSKIEDACGGAAGTSYSGGAGRRRCV